MLFRVESLSLVLLKLQQQKDEGHETCSAGRQHELLFLLNKAYLDKSYAEGGKPVDLIESTPTFLLESLSLYIEEQLKRRPKEEQGRLMLN